MPEFKRSRSDGGATILVLPKGDRALNHDDIYWKGCETRRNLQAVQKDMKATQNSPTAAVERC